MNYLNVISFTLSWGGGGGVTDKPEDIFDWLETRRHKFSQLTMRESMEPVVAEIDPQEGD